MDDSQFIAALNSAVIHRFDFVERIGIDLTRKYDPNQDEDCQMFVDYYKKLYRELFTQPQEIDKITTIYAEEAARILEISEELDGGRICMVLAKSYREMSKNHGIIQRIRECVK